MMTDLLALLNWEPPTVTKQQKKSPLPKKTPPKPRRKKIDLSLSYSAFDDDYFWELIRKDYGSAWRYVDRMTKTLSS
jgi:hypothetical protein